MGVYLNSSNAFTLYMANMIASFFSKGNDSHELFDKLDIADSEEYETSINQHNVIYIRFNETPADCSSCQRYISRINSWLLRNLKFAYPEIKFEPDEAVWDRSECCELPYLVIRKRCLRFWSMHIHTWELIQ